MVARRIPPLVPWEQLATDFHGADVLLGNGFSVSLDDRFAYPSLFQSFIDSEDRETQERFESLGSTNFEYLLESLSRAQWINERFGLPAEPLRTASDTLRDGLIAAVGRVHPRFGAVDIDRLRHLCHQFANFRDIYTTNYDALLYHIIMIAKDRWEQDRGLRPYNDYFWHRRPDNFLEFRDYQNIPFYKHIYYLHGALFLFSMADADVKLRVGALGEELVDIIARRIREGEIPLFVSEGTAGEKRAAIHRSEYLSFALEHLRKEDRPIVVYGFSFSEADEHIARALKERSQPIAISVLVENDRPQQSQAFRLHVLAELLGQDVRFFRSSELFGAEI